MARVSAQNLLETSLLGRLLAFLLVIWDESLLGRSLASVGRYLAQIFPASFIGQVWLSDWPNARHGQASLIGRLLARVNGGVARLGESLGPVVRGATESSLLMRTARLVVRPIKPYLGTSLFFQGYMGFANDVALAPNEVGRRPVSPAVYLLGAVLGFIPLIPAEMPGVPSPTVLMIAGVWGTALVWFLHKMATGDFHWRASSAFLPFTFLLMVAGAATVQSVLPRASLLSLVIWLTAGLLFFMCVNLVRDSRAAAALLGPILVGACLITVWAVYQFFVPPVIEERWVDPATSGDIVRVFASMGNPNYLAEYMALYLPLGIALWLQHPKRRLEMAIPVGLMALALVLTYSRGGWLALLIALLILVLLRFRRWSFLLVLGGLVAPLVAPESVVRRFLAAFNPEDTSNVYRLSLYQGVIAMLEKFWALGSGLGAEAFAAVYQEFMLSEARAAHAHNIYLQVAAEMGVLGLIAVLLTLFVILRRTIVVGGNSRNAILIAAVPAALIGLLFHGLVEHIWYNPKLLFAFWAVAGLGMGLALGDREDATT